MSWTGTLKDGLITDITDTDRQKMSERPEIYGMKDWSHEEQVKHIMSVTAAYPPGTKPPTDWPFYLFCAGLVVLAVVAMGGLLAGIAYLIGG